VILGHWVFTIFCRVSAHQFHLIVQSVVTVWQIESDVPAYEYCSFRLTVKFNFQFPVLLLGFKRRKRI
jgi:hypothetical protein